MNNKPRIAFIGGDLRQDYMVIDFYEKGYDLAIYGLKMRHIP